MKILFLAPDAVRPNGEGSYAHHNLRAPLIQLGQQIIDYDFRAGLKAGGPSRVRKDLLQLIDRERPDVLFHMHCTDEFPATLAETVAQQSDITLVVFFSDDDWRLRDSLDVAARYHVVITTCQEAVAEYHRHGIAHVVYAPYACNPTLYYPMPVASQRYDVTFVGQAYRGRPELVQWLKEQGVGIRVWGRGWEEHRGLRDIAGGFLPHRQMLEVFSASKIVLGMSWVSGDGVTLQIKGRTFEYAACRAFQLTTYDSRLKAFFRENEEIVFYRNREELLEQIRFYLSHEAEREAIAHAAYDRVLDAHTWIHRLQHVVADIAGRRRARPSSADGATPSHDCPLVSVLTYVYNGERYIAELIESVLGQSYRHFEFLILDDGSTDGTKAIVHRYLHDPRIRYVYQENIGKNLDAFHELINRSVALTSGDLVCFAGADDIYLPEKLAVQVQAFLEDPGLHITFSDGYHIDAHGRTLPSDFRFAESMAFTRRSLLRTLFKKNIVAHPTVMMKRAVIADMGGFEDGYTTDPHFWLKAAPHLRFRYVDQKLIKYRIHEGGSSTNSNNRTVPETIRLLTTMRSRYTIVDLYPEVLECPNRQETLYSAYLHFGNLLLTANIPVPALAVMEYARALEHRPGALEAVNNAAVGLWIVGAQDKARPLIAALEKLATGQAAIRHNLSLFRELQSPHPQVTQGFILLSESAQRAALLSALDPPHDLTGEGDRGRWPIAAIQPCECSDASPQRAAELPDQQKATPGARPSQSSDSSDDPLVSVIIPTCNRPQQLIQAVSSVLAQTYRNVEIIVVNDAGEEVEQVLSPLNAGRHITYVRHGRNLERSAARNTGLRLARGKYIAYLDDDDRYLPHHLETLVRFLETHDYRVVYSDAWRVSEERRGDRYIETGRDLPYSRDFDATQLLIGNYVPILSVMHERACLEDVGYFDESLASHEDWDLWIRLSRRYRFAHLKEITAEFTWRTDGSSTTSRNRPDFVRTAEVIYRKYRAITEAIPGVSHLQALSLKALREATGGQTESFTCSIIIPVWNKVELTQQCLLALAEVTDGVTYEVIVVDNGSTDGTPEFLSQLGGDVRVIHNAENLGFARACNQGAKTAKGEFLVFLNNDTIPLKGWLSAMVEEVRNHSDVAVVGSKLLYEDGTIQHAGVAFSREWYVPYHIYKGVKADAPAVSRRREFKCVTAACMLVRRDVFFSVDGFDEGYRNGFEDVDLCLKIGRKTWKIVYQPKSVLYHLESRTPGRKAHEKENSRRLFERWGECWWLPDEDWIHLEDGYAFHTVIRDEKLSYRLVAITDAATRAQRTVVADVQRAAHRQDRATVLELLQRPNDWPADAWILRWAPLLCLGVARPDLAAPFWRRVLTLEEDDRARVALAKAALAQGDLREAETHLAQLLEHHPAHGEGWLLRGIVAMQHQAYAEAGAAFARARQYRADQRKATLGMVMAAVGAQRYEEAWGAALPLSETVPDDEECLHWLLRCGTALERWETLESRLKVFVARNPAHLAMRFARAGVLIRLGRRDEARSEFDRIRLLDPSFEGLDEFAKQVQEAEGAVAIGHVQ